MHSPPDRSERQILSDRALAKARQEFGCRVRELREGRDWSQLEASRRSGLSQGEWSRVERGETNPSLTTLLRMQHALGFESIETLFGEAPSRRLIG